MYSFCTVFVIGFCKDNLLHEKFIYTFYSKTFGRGGIRTLGNRKATPVFKTGAFDHSATLPITLKKNQSQKLYVLLKKQGFFNKLITLKKLRFFNKLRFCTVFVQFLSLVFVIGFCIPCSSQTVFINYVKKTVQKLNFCHWFLFLKKFSIKTHIG